MNREQSDRANYILSLSPRLAKDSVREIAPEWRKRTKGVMSPAKITNRGVPLRRAGKEHWPEKIRKI